MILYKLMFTDSFVRWLSAAKPVSSLWPGNMYFQARRREGATTRPAFLCMLHRLPQCGHAQRQDTPSSGYMYASSVLHHATSVEHIPQHGTGSGAHDPHKTAPGHSPTSVHQLVHSSTLQGGPLHTSPRLLATCQAFRQLITHTQPQLSTPQQPPQIMDPAPLLPTSSHAPHG
jgi:hypothetical protein